LRPGVREGEGLISRGKRRALQLGEKHPSCRDELGENVWESIRGAARRGPYDL